jgi:hypothetical protein
MYLFLFIFIELLDFNNFLKTDLDFGMGTSLYMFTLLVFMLRLTLLCRHFCKQTHEKIVSDAIR